MDDEVTVGVRGDRRTPTVTSAARTDRGAVTAEAAMVIPVLIAITIGLVWLVSVVVTQVRVVDGARETARLAARGEPDGVATRHGGRVAPEGTVIRVSRGADRIRVTATAVVRGPGGLFGFLPRSEQTRSRRRSRDERAGRARPGHTARHLSGGRTAVHDDDRCGVRTAARGPAARGRSCRPRGPGWGGRGAARAARLLGGTQQHTGERRRTARVPVRGGPGPRSGSGAVAHPSGSRRAGRGLRLRRAGGEQDVEQPRSRILVKGVVAVAALGRLHAGRAAAVAPAGADRLPGCGEPSPR
jgi:hypothetical protein